MSLIVAYGVLSSTLSVAKIFYSSAYSLVLSGLGLSSLIELAYDTVRATLWGGNALLQNIVTTISSSIYSPSPPNITNWADVNIHTPLLDPRAQLSLARNALLSAASVLAASKISVGWDVLEITHNITYGLDRITHDDSQIQTLTTIVSAQ